MLTICQKCERNQFTSVFAEGNVLVNRWITLLSLYFLTVLMIVYFPTASFSQDTTKVPLLKITTKLGVTTTFPVKTMHKNLKEDIVHKVFERNFRKILFGKFRIDAILLRIADDIHMGIPLKSFSHAEIL